MGGQQVETLKTQRCQELVGETERVELPDGKTMSGTMDPLAIARALGEHGEVIREASATPRPCFPVSLLLLVDCTVVGGSVTGITVKAGVWGQTFEKHQENDTQLYLCKR